MPRLQLYVDDSDPSIQYIPSTAWGDNESPSWTGGRSKEPIMYPGATLQFTFNGTVAIFHGLAINNFVFVPIIDTLPYPNITLPISTPPSYGEWYRTPELPSGLHTVIIQNVPSVTLDYIIVEVDSSPAFAPNTSILISDSDPSIEYSGGWKQGHNPLEFRQPFTFLGNYSTSSSCNPGASLSLDFSGPFTATNSDCLTLPLTQLIPGSSVELWGVFNWTSIGQITAAYSVDGQRLGEQRYEVNSTSQSSVFGTQANFPWFGTPKLSNGTHNLVVNITSCTNQSFSLDYITFGSSSDEATPLSTPTKAFRFPHGAIAGIVVGVLMLAIAGLILRWFCIAHRKNLKPAGIAPLTVPPPSSVVVAQKEEVPAYMRQLRSPHSSGTIHAKTGRITSPTLTLNEAPVPARNLSETRNTNEFASDIAPPAYPGSIAGDNVC